MQFITIHAGEQWDLGPQVWPHGTGLLGPRRGYRAGVAASIHDLRFPFFLWFYDPVEKTNNPPLPPVHWGPAVGQSQQCCGAR